MPDARGWLHALDAKTGKELWKANDGNHAQWRHHQLRSERQAVRRDRDWLPEHGQRWLPDWFGGQYKYMEKDTGALIVYTLE